MRRLILLLLVGLSLSAGTDPWTDNDLIQPEQASKDLHTALFIRESFPVLYRSVHITSSVFAGPGSKEEGIADLKRAVVCQPRTPWKSFSTAAACAP